MEVREKAKMTGAQVVSILSREKSDFLDGLSPTEVDTIVAKASIRRYAANTVISTEADGANHLFLLLDGAARAYALTARGEKIGLGWSSAGRVIGWAALVSKRREFIVSFEAVKNSSALVWDRATIQSLAATYPKLVENALAMAYDYLVRIRILHLAAICDSAPQRLAQVLGHLAKGMGHTVTDGIELRISNEELANEAHVTIFTVSRLMRDWQRQGLLTKGWCSVVVRQPDALLRVET
jgi:CRP/FNR family transcriptional regulator, nitrogen oxide reductase regulator